ncbi:NADP oxidoreductase, partial [Candidatus Bipolaricaulota bacterium]|nr:NADP oxidoreductase [Candidatus Bipolaricaulota bacterium]
MRNGIPTDKLIEDIYGKGTTTNGKLPYDVVPQLLDRVRPIHEVVPVEFFLHGCPPPPGVIAKAILALLDGKTPELVGEDLKFG